METLVTLCLTVLIFGVIGKLLYAWANGIYRP